VSGRGIEGPVCSLTAASCLLACGAFEQARQAAEDSRDLTLPGATYHAHADDPVGVGTADADEWLRWARTRPDHGAVCPVGPHASTGRVAPPTTPKA